MQKMDKLVKIATMVAKRQQPDLGRWFDVQGIESVGGIEHLFYTKGNSPDMWSMPLVEAEALAKHWAVVAHIVAACCGNYKKAEKAVYIAEAVI